MTEAPILEIRNLSKTFSQPVSLGGRIANLFGGKNRPVHVHAVQDVDITVESGEVVGIVGESGCGKSTVARMLAGISTPSGGSLRWRGKDVAEMTAKEHRAFDLGVQMIFQDPFASLNPRMRIGDIIGEAAVKHGRITRREQRDYVVSLMEKVGLSGAYIDRFPHQFSGGQRQRIGIARALAVNPDLIICDESVAALDVSIQAQVLNLFMDLRDELDLTYLFISHNLGVVEHISDRVVIMYLGRVVEVAPTDALYGDPNHPYTRLLIEQVPSLEAGKRDYAPIAGELPSPLDPPSGCAFNPRCPWATERCRTERPALREIAPGRLSACHLNDPA
ncbi:ABC transporter ATP-binding protein [Sagittula stellata]|uniref:Putative transport ATP-binding protein n=1 Tax=Sagittula stellata (strain ATCC 700073 / DSM 11524 / E-37) TaxID=388399 RepID=A3K819_SAGS3|nr:oligopeptide/dipeptide ABC transporter ATP-binding protein [Sagittula stellata]EBA06791.1 putative transport ATP-binding protein [Sagittula stellata E-37]